MEKTPDLDLSDRVVDDPDTPAGSPTAPIVDMGSYEFAPCPADVNVDCAVNVNDLVDLLLCYGEPAVPDCEGEDVNGDGSVNVLDLVQLLLAFGDFCSCAESGLNSKSLEEELNEAGLTMDDWDEYMDVMLNGNNGEKKRYNCWMTHYLSECPTITCPPNCPGQDPFGNH